MEQTDVTSTLAQITPISDMRQAAAADLIIEAATENVDIKKLIFKELDRYAKEGAILATNTSSLPITDLASVTNRPEAVIGMHFMNLYRG